MHSIAIKLSKLMVTWSHNKLLVFQYPQDFSIYQVALMQTEHDPAREEKMATTKFFSEMK